MPTYNQSQYIGQAIDSVLAQTMEDWELIVVDNHSTDGTPEVIDSYGDPRIRRIEIHNNGVIAASRNLGIAQASGWYVAFLDSDDVWLPHKLQLQVDYLRAHPDIALLGGRFHFLQGDQVSPEPRPKDFYLRLPRHLCLALVKNVFITSSVIAPKNVIDAYNGFDESPGLIAIEDFDLWFRIVENHETAIHDTPVLHYRIHERNTGKGVKRFAKTHLGILSKWRTRMHPALWTLRALLSAIRLTQRAAMAALASATGKSK